MISTPTVFDRYQDSLNAELEEILDQREGLLYNMMLYQMGWVDQQGSPLPRPRPFRPHSLLCLLSCEVLGIEYSSALPAAAALELVHTFTVVHKDVQVGNPQREEIPSVWWVWGPGQAINVGDGLHALGRTALFRLADYGLPPGRVLKTLGALDEACIKMCEGQYLDLSYQDRLDLSVRSYIKMAEGNTGALTACAMELGALIATDNQEIINVFKLSGLKLGVAYQIRKDIQALWGKGTGQPASPEVLNKKKLYPVVQLLEKGDLKTKRHLGNIYFKRVLEESDIQEILSLLEEASSRQLAETAAASYYRAAMEILDELALPKERMEQLARLGRYIVEGVGKD